MKKPVAKRLLSKPEREERARRASIIVVAASVMLGLVGIVVCGYGHAAIYSSLGISGDATVKASHGFGIKTMQEMTSEVCENAYIGTEEQLRDTRDGKYYWVHKMADGECWMMQNLALVLTEEMINNGRINSANTDINGTTSYTPWTRGDGVILYAWDNNAKYPPTPTEVVASNAAPTKKTASNITTYSWSFGDVVRTSPTVTSGSACNTTNILKCSYFSNVAGMQSTLDYRTAGKTYDSSTGNYDAHFLIGTYYQFPTATASSLYDSSGNAPSSICPKGWRLPASDTSKGTNNTLTKSLMKLTYTYGYTYSNGGDVAKIDGVNKNLSQDPLYIVRAGYILISGTSPVQSAITRGYVLTGYASSKTSNYYLRPTENGLGSNVTDVRHHGRNIRCVAR